MSNAAGILERVGAVRQGHFVLASGNHSPTYVNKDAIYTRPLWTDTLACEIAEVCGEWRPDVVLGPVIGGALLAQWVTYRLSLPLHVYKWFDPNRTILAAYADRGVGKFFVLKRGYGELVNGKRVLVVEDVITTGASAVGVVGAVRRCGGSVVGVAAIVNRTGKSAADLAIGMDISVVHCLLDMDIPMWPVADCPLCKQGVSISTNLGKGL